MADQAKQDLEYPFMAGVIFPSDDEDHAPSGTKQNKQGKTSGVQGKKALGKEKANTSKTSKPKVAKPKVTKPNVAKPKAPKKTKTPKAENDDADGGEDKGGDEGDAKPASKIVGYRRGIEHLQKEPGLFSGVDFIAMIVACKNDERNISKNAQNLIDDWVKKGGWRRAFEIDVCESSPVSAAFLHVDMKAQWSWIRSFRASVQSSFPDRQRIAI